ncbi:MAG TPA: MmcQ/YjbR family DNA-binding protein [Fimbriimonas sp.]|nr:MmcQ/YjbR family DNA-binding protein [Fimbriimonas sp.]
MAKEHVTEEYPWGDTCWKVKGKMFACTGGDGRHVTVKSTLDKQQALVQHPNIEVAAYVGRYGWVRIEIVDDEVLELARDLIDESYDAVARKQGKRRAQEPGVLE